MQLKKVLLIVYIDSDNSNVSSELLELKVGEVPVDSSLRTQKLEIELPQESVFVKENHASLDLEETSTQFSVLPVNATSSYSLNASSYSAYTFVENSDECGTLN